MLRGERGRREGSQLLVGKRGIYLVGVLRRDGDVLGESPVPLAPDNIGFGHAFLFGIDREVHQHPPADARHRNAVTHTDYVTGDVQPLYPRELHRLSPAPAARGFRVVLRTVSAFAGPDVGVVYTRRADLYQYLAAGRLRCRYVFPVL